MAAPSEEYRAFLREVIEVTRHATHAVEESQGVLEEVLEELADLRKAQESANRLDTQEADRKLKTIEICKSAIESRWFSALMPVIVTWVLMLAAWYFGAPLPVVGSSVAPLSTTEDGSHE